MTNRYEITLDEQELQDITTALANTVENFTDLADEENDPEEKKEIEDNARDIDNFAGTESIGSKMLSSNS